MSIALFPLVMSVMSLVCSRKCLNCRGRNLEEQTSSRMMMSIDGVIMVGECHSDFGDVLRP